jgi:hypothetical protein
MLIRQSKRPLRWTRFLALRPEGTSQVVPSEVANKDAKSDSSTDRVEKYVVRENSLRYREMQAPNDATDSSPVGLGPGHHEATEQAITKFSEQSLPGCIPARNNGDGVSHSLLDQADHLSEHEKLYDTLFNRLRKALLTDFDTKVRQRQAAVRLA